MFSTTAKRATVIAATALTAASGLALTTTQAHATTTSQTTVSAMVYAGIGATLRTAPTTHAPSVGTLKQWAPVDIVCHVVGPRASGSNIWYRVINPTVGGDAGRWIIASATSNTNADRVPLCNGGTPAAAVTTAAVNARTGASTLDPSLAVMPKGTKLTVSCKVQNGSQVWYMTNTTRWVSGAYVRPAHDVKFCGVPQI